MAEAGQIQYLCMFLCREDLCYFETLSGNTDHTKIKNLNQTILVIGKYLFPVNDLSKKKCMLRRKKKVSMRIEGQMP